MPEDTPVPAPEAKTVAPSITPAPPPVPDLPPPVSPNLTKAELTELLAILDRSLEESVKMRNDIAKMLGVEARPVPVLPVAPIPPVTDVPLEPVCPDSMIERGELINKAIREEIAHSNKVFIRTIWTEGAYLEAAKEILRIYQSRWGWIPSEATIKHAVKLILTQAKAPAAPVSIAVAPIPPASPASGKKPASPQDAILQNLSTTEYRTYKDLSEKVTGLGFTLGQFSDAYSELTSKRLVIEEGNDKIRKAK